MEHFDESAGGGSDAAREPSDVLGNLAAAVLTAERTVEAGALTVAAVAALQALSEADACLRANGCDCVEEGLAPVVCGEPEAFFAPLGAALRNGKIHRVARLLLGLVLAIGQRLRESAEGASL